MRAVEQGLPVVRAANTGISAMIDPYGRILAEIGLGEKGVVDADLPKVGPPTLFVQFGIVLEISVLALALLPAGSPVACNLLAAPLTQRNKNVARLPCLTR